MKTYQEIFLAFSIGILISMTISRAIYLYYSDEYKILENRWKPHNLYNNQDNNHQEKMDILDKKLTMKRFKITLSIATFLLILGSMIQNQTIGQGIMIGSVIIIVFNSLLSWRFLEEGEKFTLTILSLSILLIYVYYRYK